MAGIDENNALQLCGGGQTLVVTRLSGLIKRSLK